MEELIKLASLIPTVLFFALGVGILILMADALFIFAELCARLSQRVLKIIAKRFEEKEP